MGHLPRGWGVRRGRRARATRNNRRAFRRPRFEPLEDRHLLATLTVNSVLDNTTAGDGFVTLREAILAANADGVTDLGESGSGADTIVFDPVVFATPQTILMSMGEFQITQALAIDGTGKDNLTINGQILSRLFNVTGSQDVTFAGLTLTGGKATGNGGAILSSAGVNVVDSLITGNLAAGNGGGIFSGRVLVSGSSVTGNSVISGSTAGVVGGLVTVTDSIVSGGVFVLPSGIANYEPVSIAGSTITSGGVEGGPINITNSEVTGLVRGKMGDVQILGSTLHNGVSALADVLFNYHQLVVEDSTIEGTIQTGFQINRITVSNSALQGGAGDAINAHRAEIALNSSTIQGSKDGIVQSSGSVTLNNSHILDGTGRGIVMLDAGQVALVGSTIERNLGGGIVITIYEQFNSKVDLASSSVKDNGSAATASSGGIWARNVALVGSTVSGNRAFSQLNGPSLGGGITAETVSLTSSTVSGNSTNSSGGGLRTRMATVTNSTISGNSTNANGGGVYGDNVTVLNSTISSNMAGGLGGGILSTGIGETSLKYSTIANNQAASGGGIWKENGALTVSNSIVAKNTGGINPDLHSAGGMVAVTSSLIGDNAGTSLVEAQTPDTNGNLIGSAAGGGAIDPLLGLLADNGGPTKTHALLVGSPAIDAIPYVPPADPFGDAVHIYQLNGSLADAKGGPALVALGGVQTTTGYLFGPNEGLTLSAPSIEAGEYTIEIVFSWDVISGGWQKILDFKDLVNDTGLYTLDEGLRFESEAFSDDRFAAGQLSQLVLTRDDATNEVRGYINGAQVWSFIDHGEFAVFSGPNSVMRFFQDDYASSQAEAQSGFVDRIRIFDRVLSNLEIIQMANPGPQPGPPLVDQRGYPYQRIADGDGVGGAQIDMGAFEYQVFTPAALPGDYNLDGTVDAADYTVWRDLSGLQVPPFSSADGNGNGVVDGDDYGVWVANFGQSLAVGGSGGAASFAEPLAAAVEEVAAEAAARAIDFAGFWNVASATERGGVDTAADSATNGGSAGHDLALLAWLTARNAALDGEDGESGPLAYDDGPEADDGVSQSLELAFADL